MLRRLKDFFNPHDLHKVIGNASRLGHRKFLVIWNRGLGDIPLGLYAFVQRVKEYILDAEITFITRPDLLEAFSLLEGVHAVQVPWWQRGNKLTKSDATDALKRLALQTDYDVIIESIDPTHRLSDQIGRIVPRLIWHDSYDAICKKFAASFAPHIGKTIVGVHLQSETQGCYGYKKDWDIERWQSLLHMMSREDFFIVLFGLKKDPAFSAGNILDLRGETNLLECLSIIKNYCNVFLAPDSGILSITYYIDAFFPLLVISLWADPNQGVLKQKVHSPNKGLRHIPLIGKDRDISDITVAQVYEAIKKGMLEMNRSGECR